MSRTGTQFVTLALREIQVLDPTATASGEQLDDGVAAATDLLDTWRIDHLTIGGTTINQYTLTSGTSSYTLGAGGVWNQTYPEEISKWSVIADVTASKPLEIPMGRPATDDEWQQIRVKANTGTRPRALYFDKAWTAGLGTVLIYPVPSIANIGIRLYDTQAAMTALVAATTYNLRPGAQRAFQLALALELADRYGRLATVTPRLEKRAASALGMLKRSNMAPPRESPIRPAFVIGQAVGRRTFNVYTGSN